MPPWNAGLRADIYLELLKLRIVSFYRCLPAEDRHRELHFSLFRENLDNRPHMTFKGSGFYLDDIARPEINLDFGFRLVFTDLPHDLFHFFFSERNRMVSGADKASHAWGMPNDIPRLVVKTHLDKNITGKKLASHLFALSLFYGDTLLNRDEDAKNTVLHTHRGNSLFEICLDAIFVPCIRLYYIPAARFNTVHTLRGSCGPLTSLPISEMIPVSTAWTGSGLLTKEPGKDSCKYHINYPEIGRNQKRKSDNDYC